MEIDGARALRCDLCGDVIGQMFGDDPTPAMRERINARCYACAASESADRILSEASSSATSESENTDG